MSINVLIVDDSETARSVLSKTMRLTDLPLDQVYMAENGREALDILNDNWIDLVLADINMPLMNGVEMVERMFEDGLLKAARGITTIEETMRCLPRFQKPRSIGELERILGK